MFWSLLSSSRCFAIRSPSLCACAGVPVRIVPARRATAASGRQDAHTGPTSVRRAGLPLRRGGGVCRPVRSGVRLCAREASRAACVDRLGGDRGEGVVLPLEPRHQVLEICHALTEGAILSVPGGLLPEGRCGSSSREAPWPCLSLPGSEGSDRTGRLQESHACPACIKWSNGTLHPPVSADPSQKCTQNPPSRRRSAGDLRFCDGSAVLGAGRPGLGADQRAGIGTAVGRRRRGTGWQTGQKNDERFMNATRRIGVPQREQGSASRP